MRASRILKSDQVLLGLIGGWLVDSADLRSDYFGQHSKTNLDDGSVARGDPGSVAFYTSDPEDQETFKAAAERLGLSFEDLGVFCRCGFKYEQIPVKAGDRWSLLAYLKRTETVPAKWVMISGLYPDVLHSEGERRKRLRALHKAATLLIKRALARAAADPYRAERGLGWEPIAEVCRDLEIAPSKLSALLKEFCGSSLSQVIDCVRVERIKKVLKGQVRAFVRGWIAHRATLGAEKQEEVTASAVWKALKGSRKWPAFCQNSWAVGLGFSSYRRMYRGCLAVLGMTPHQLETGLIEEILKEGEVGGAVEEVESSVEQVEEAVRGIGVYCDES